MKNFYALQPATVVNVTKENLITASLRLKLENQNQFEFLAGQFMQIGLPGFGECPISISSNPKDAKKYFTLTIRGVGELTRKLIELKKGATVFVRGPFGNGFPEVNKNLILIAGGCGFLPLRSVYLENKDRKDIKIQLFLGGKDKSSLLFVNELEGMKKNSDVNVILEQDCLVGFEKQVGMVTKLIQQTKLLDNPLVFICGPDVMYKFVLKELLAKNVNPENIYVSLEKRMHCGVGICQHCACGKKYVCKDGPVFRWSECNEETGNE